MRYRHVSLRKIPAPALRVYETQQHRGPTAHERTWPWTSITTPSLNIAGNTGRPKGKRIRQPVKVLPTQLSAYSKSLTHNEQLLLLLLALIFFMYFPLTTRVWSLTVQLQWITPFAAHVLEHKRWSWYDIVTPLLSGATFIYTPVLSETED